MLNSSNTEIKIKEFPNLQTIEFRSHFRIIPIISYSHCFYSHFSIESQAIGGKRKVTRGLKVIQELSIPNFPSTIERKANQT